MPWVHGCSQDFFRGGGGNTFRKIRINFLRKLLKIHYFSIPCVKFLRVWTKKRKSLGNFEKMLKIFLKKIAKNSLFQHIFQKINKACVNFSRVWTKIANCQEILKIFDENSIEKWNFYFILENLLLKIETSEITPFFYKKFSVSGGGGFPPPRLRPCLGGKTQGRSPHQREA